MSLISICHPLLLVSCNDRIVCLSSTRQPGLLLDFGVRSISQTIWSVFTGYEHPSALSSSWRLSSTELSIVPHLSTYRISCSTLPIFRRDAVVASAHRLPIFSTSARHVCVTVGLLRHSQHFVGS